MSEFIYYSLYFWLVGLVIIGILFVIFMVIWFVVDVIQQIKWEKEHPGWSK